MILRGATLCELDPLRVEQRDLRIVEDTIVERGEKFVPAQGEEVIDLDGAVVLPGLVNAHTHLYSSLARGMPPPERAPKNFPEILDLIWWRLDRALDLPDVQASALVGAHDAALCGVTTVVDHHASPNAIAGSLAEVRAALSKVGVRGVVAYETTDRCGAAGTQAGLQENADALRAQTADLRALVGAHACLTLSDESIAACGSLARAHASGVHIHAAEAVEDRNALERLVGVLGEKTLIAHGVHLSEPEIARVRQSGAWLLHCPRSNLNNGVGTASAAKFGARAALGTDGIGNDLFEELRCAFFRSQETKNPLSMAQAIGLLSGGHRLATELFDRPFGALRQGAVADLIIFDYAAPTPLNTESLAGHLLYGFSTRYVRDVLCAGRWIVRNGEHVSWSASKVAHVGQEAAARIWPRLHKPMKSLLS